MKKIKPQIKGRIRFLATENGGRKLPIVAKNFGCLFGYDGNFYDCKFILDQEDPIKPGDERIIGIAFLNPHLVLDKLSLGSSFILKELNIIAEGTVESKFNN